MRMNVSIGKSVSDKSGKGVAAKASVAKALHAESAVNAVAMESPAVVDSILSELLEEGLVELPGIEPVPECSVPDDDEFDGDLDMSDEDEFVEEVQDRGRFADFTAPFVEDVYDMVMKRADGCVVFDPPENAWEGATGKTPEAVAALNELSARMRVYREISGILGGVGSGLAGPVEESLPGVLGSQSDFARVHKVDAGNLSRYLNNARVVCGDRSLPLRALFRR